MGIPEFSNNPEMAREQRFQAALAEFQQALRQVYESHQIEEGCLAEITTKGYPNEILDESLIAKLNLVLAALHDQPLDELDALLGVRNAFKRAGCELVNGRIHSESLPQDPVEFNGNDKYGLQFGLGDDWECTEIPSSEVRTRAFIFLFSRYLDKNEYLSRVVQKLFDAGLPLRPFATMKLNQLDR